MNWLERWRGRYRTVVHKRAHAEYDRRYFFEHQEAILAGCAPFQSWGVAAIGPGSFFTRGYDGLGQPHYYERAYGTHQVLGVFESL